MSMSLPTPRVLGDVIPGGLARDSALVLGGAALTALAAQVSVPLPFTPVPLTLQTFAVLLVGAALGTTRGVLSMLVYLAVGVAGAPVFSHGTSGSAGASFGYDVGFVLAAALVGLLAERGATRGPLRTGAVMVLGNLTIYAVGVPWLMAVAHVDLPKALALGVVPFLIGDAIKVAVAAGMFPAAWRLAGRR
ncbi:biotin transporter BioY [Lapillicoccus sp.]|uniref:biotin transporter BioY n=1 Tax=Lapillicoccus sp. TaxID=1909287 RepID=UPI003264567F